jgi:hypothetical protein
VIPSAWSTPFGSYLWQVALHSTVMGVVFYIWAHRVRVSSGRTKRRLLALLLVLPMITAAVPGRSSIDFAERRAWLDSARLLAVPLLGGFRVYHVAIVLGLLTLVITIGQELLPALRRSRAVAEGVPDTILELVRRQPGWDATAVMVTASPAIVVALRGVWRPRLIVSQGALESLSHDEWSVVLAHEHAHWADGGWLRQHLLFAIRLFQCYHPVALWAFREYCVELEIGCDAKAVKDGAEARTLARVLLNIYRRTDRRDAAARGSLRKRVDVLLGQAPVEALPTGSVAAAAGLMGVVLPWLV